MAIQPSPGSVILTGERSADDACHPCRTAGIDPVAALWGDAGPSFATLRCSIYRGKKELPMRTSDRSRNTKAEKAATAEKTVTSKKAAKPGKAVKADPNDLKRHQVSLDDDRWDWLDGLPGGASKGLRALIDLAREKGFRLADDEAGDTVAFEPEVSDTVLAAVAEPAVATPVADDALDAVIAAAEHVTLTAGIDPTTYVPGGDFHVPDAKVYAGILGTAVNKKAEHMAKVVYEPAHLNAKAEGMWRGQGKDFATWVFSEEPGLTEKLLESGLELLMDVTLEPGASVGYHVHRRTEEVYYLLAGSLTVATVIGDGNVHTETLQAGDAHLVRRGQGHSCEAGSEGARFITVAGRL
jgi:quercetin dioxygenase-like cupin family protein